MPDEKAALGEEPALREDNPVAQTLEKTIRAGEVESLKCLLHDHPGLDFARIVDGEGRLYRRRCAL